MSAYYNEIDKYAAQWLRNLISAGHIAAGDVDERSIQEVEADDLRTYDQCHFFAGIGGWSYALRFAGWPDERYVWTGSCPCQPFSTAGKQKAQKDERHLWPAWFKLIAEIHPPVIFGEQVAGAITHEWLDDTFDDLEREGYETGAAVLPACSVGAPHKRDRLWFVAHTDQQRSQGWYGGELPGCSNKQFIGSSSTFLENSDSGGFSEQGVCEEQSRGTEVERASKNVPDSSCGGRDERGTHPRRVRQEPRALPERGGLANGNCDRSHWLVEPAVGRVANGVPARSHKLRAYGNAIVPQVAAEFIKAAGV